MRHRHGGCASRRRCIRSWAESAKSSNSVRSATIHYLATSSRASHSACTTQTASLAWPGIPSSGSCCRGQGGFGLAACLRASLGLVLVRKPGYSNATSRQRQRSAQEPTQSHHGGAPEYLADAVDCRVLWPLETHTDGSHLGRC